MLHFGEDAVPEGARGESGRGGFVEPEGLSVETPEAEDGGQNQHEGKNEAVGEARGRHGGEGYAKTLRERNEGGGGKFVVEGRGTRVVESRPFRKRQEGKEKS